MASSYNRIKWKYFSFILFLAIILIGFRIYFDTKHHKLMLNEKVEELEKNIHITFNRSIDSLQEKYTILSGNVLHLPEIYTFYTNNDRDGLYKYIKSNYENLKMIDKNLFVMHFFDNKNVIFLRLHKPESFGDDLTDLRPIVKYVNQTKKIAYGFEVGKNGIVYRITSPYIYDGNHLGALEFGIKLNYFTDILDQSFDVYSEIMIKSDLLDVLSKKNEFDNKQDYSIVSTNSFFNSIKNKIDLDNPRQIIKDAGKSFIVLTDLYLNDYDGNKVAKICIAKDITSQIIKYEKSLFLVNSITFIALAFGISFVYFIFTKYTNELIKNNEQINKLDKQSRDFEDKSNKDELTNTYNKGYFNIYLEEFLSQNKQGVILFLDIDHFKNINDKYGHLRGDDVLKWLTQTIKTFLRSDDVFARWGGEEFVVLIENINIKMALDKAEKIRSYIESNIFVSDGLKFTISIGLTSIKENDTSKTLLHRADNLLYEAKNSGRNQIKSS